jgi:hypothetical protein
MTNSDTLIQQAVAAAKAGKREDARQILLRVVRADEENARAWMLLARVTTDPIEKRMALSNVTQLEPTNQQAHQMLAQLTIAGVGGEEDVQAAQASRSFRTMVIGGLVVMLLIIVGLITLVIVRGGQQAAENAELTRIAGNLTQIAAAQTEAFSGTQVALDATGTAIALLPTSTPTPRPSSTPEPTATPSITPTASATPIPPPPGLPGAIIGWGGSNALNDGYFPVILIALDGSGAIIELSGSNRGELVAASDRSRVVYTRYFRDTFDRYLSLIDTTTGAQENLAVRFNTNAFARATGATLTPDSRLMAFVAETGPNRNQQVYLYDFTAPVGTQAIRRLTNDDFDYGSPSISADGTQILVVRRARSPLPPNTDIMLINLATSQITPWTEDGDATIESHPRWSPDGRLVAYVAGTQQDPKGDIYLRTVGPNPSLLNVTRSPGVDEIFPVFSPDSRYLAYSSDVFSEPTRVSYNIFVYDLVVSGELYQVTRDDERYYPGAWVE